MMLCEKGENAHRVFLVSESIFVHTKQVAKIKEL